MLNYLRSFWEWLDKNWQKSRSQYNEGKKKLAILICSNLMSFSPIDFIFIGWIGYDGKFFWVLRNFDFKPANGIFSQKCTFSIFQNCVFWGYDFENWVWAKLVLWICPILWKSPKTVNTQFSLIFFHSYRPKRLIYHAIQKIIFKKITYFWIENLL